MADEMTERDLLAEISKKLDRLTAIIVVQGLDPDAKIQALTGLGFSSHEIGALVGLPAGTVRRRRATKGIKRRASS